MTNFPVEQYFAGKKRAGTVTFRDKLYRFLDSPTSSIPAAAFGFFILIVSLSSVISFGVDSTRQAISLTASLEDAMKEQDLDETEIHLLNSTSLRNKGANQGWNLFLLSVFGVELLLRLFAYVSPLTDFYVWVDIVTIAPLIMRISLSFARQGQSSLTFYLGDTEDWKGIVVYLLTSLNALRLLKMTRYFLGSQVLIKTISNSMAAVIVPAYFLILLLTLFGSILFAVEFDPLCGATAAGCGLRVPNLTTAWWMILVTMTTVGYGDSVPQSPAGRIIMFFAMILGLMVLAMPLAIVGNNFSKAWEMRWLLVIEDQVKRWLLEKGLGVTDLAAILKEFDSDGSGNIDYKEFQQALARMDVSIESEGIRIAWNLLNPDGAELDYRDLLEGLFPEVDINVLDFDRLEPSAALPLTDDMIDPAKVCSASAAATHAVVYDDTSANWDYDHPRYAQQTETATALESPGARNGKDAPDFDGIIQQVLSKQADTSRRLDEMQSSMNEILRRQDQLALALDRIETQRETLDRVMEAVAALSPPDPSRSPGVRRHTLTAAQLHQARLSHSQQSPQYI